MDWFNTKQIKIITNKAKISEFKLKNLGVPKLLLFHNKFIILKIFIFFSDLKYSKYLLNLQNIKIVLKL